MPIKLERQGRKGFSPSLIETEREGSPTSRRVWVDPSFRSYSYLLSPRPKVTSLFIARSQRADLKAEAAFIFYLLNAK